MVELVVFNRDSAVSNTAQLLATEVPSQHQTLPNAQQEKAWLLPAAGSKVSSLKEPRGLLPSGLSPLIGSWTCFPRAVPVEVLEKSDGKLVKKREDRQSCQHELTVDDILVIAFTGKPTEDRLDGLMSTWGRNVDIELLGAGKNVSILNYETASAHDKAIACCFCLLTHLVL